MNKWNYVRSVPDKVYVACSGGVDSVAVAAILSEWKDVTLVHFSHADRCFDEELEVVTNLSSVLGLPLLTERSTMSDVPNNNKEACWRTDRYKWFHSLDQPVVTGHTLDDAVEWYLMTCLRGRGEFIEYSNRNVIRPFLLTKKEAFIAYVNARNLPYWEDPSNFNIESGLRSRVRNTLVPVALECEPGLYNTVKRRIQEKNKEC